MFYKLHRSFSPVPGVLLSSSWCQSPGCSLCKSIYSFSWAYLERKSQIWPYIYNQRKQSSSPYFENERSGSQLSICEHLVCNITAIMHNIYSYFMQISHVSCIWPSGCPCLFILNTRHNSIEGISFARDLLVTVNPVSSPLMFSWNWVFKLTTIEVPSDLQTRNFQFSVIQSITMSSALLVNLMCISAKLSVKSPTSCNWGYLNFGR